MMIYDAFCRGKDCRYFMEYSFETDTGQILGEAYDCTLIDKRLGETTHVEAYPDNCPYLDEIKNYEP